MIIRKVKNLCFSIIFLFIFTVCSGCSIPTNADSAFRNFTLHIFQEEVVGNTLNLHYTLREPEKYGIKDYPVTLGSYSADSSAALAAIENLDASLHKFSRDLLSAENQLTFDILEYHLQLSKEAASFYLYNEPLSPITGIHAQLPVLLAEYQFHNEKDVETYLSLLETLPDFFNSLIQFEQQKSDAGLFMSDEIAKEVISQCEAFVSMQSENFLFSTFESRLSELGSVSEKAYNDYCQQNREILSTFVIPAYTNLASYLKDMLGNDKNLGGLCYLPNGKSYYEHLIKQVTGSSLTIEQLSQLIQSQILTDLADSQTLLNDNPSLLQQASASYDSPETILKMLKERIANAFPKDASVNVTVKCVPTSLEAYLSPAFYLIPAIDSYNENIIYINQAHPMKNLSLFTTLAHEGYPGHLYQTTYFSSTNPDPLRTILNFPGYVEGWATYAEMCSYYISNVEKNTATLMQKNSSVILGLYATADIGIHYDGWDFQQTLAFFSKYGIDDSRVVQDIYQLILGDPANYLTYYVGYVEILGLKKEMIEKMGVDFSQKEFHKRLLELGPAPFEIIRNYLYIEQ